MAEKTSRMGRWGWAALVAVALGAGFFHFSSPNPKGRIGNTALSSRAGGDAFPDKARIRHAQGFAIRYQDGYKVVDIANPFNASPDTARYVLFPRGAARPKVAGRVQYVEVPVRTLICLSTTHVGLTDFLGVNDRVIAMADTGRVLNEDFKERIRQGKIVEVGKDEVLNQELVITLAPDLLMTVGFPGREMGASNALMESGIAVVVNSEWKERSLLGRMEWVKLLAAFLNKEALAEAKFDSIETEYGKIKALAASAVRKPRVMGGISRKGVWTIPGGRSYVAAMLKDAGADYPWAGDTTTGSREISFEAVYQEALEAEFWLSAGWAKSLRDIAHEDPRYRDFRSFKTKNIFNNTKRIAANNSNDYWESGLVNPHVILADFVKILHPELMPGHELYYSLKLE
jgi:iron complex transport system substrate-binding protein